MRKDTVILIPSYEPDNELIKVVENLYREGFNILVVNDGSDDGYDEIFSEATVNAKYIKQFPNKGKGAAIKNGFSNVKTLFPEAKYVITADGDVQHSIADIIKVYDKLKSDNEIVLGMRHFDKKVPFKSVFGNLISKVNRSLFTKEYVGDDQCGLRGFPIRYLDELTKIKGDRYEYEMNVITIIQLKNYLVKVVDVEAIYLDKENSRSHFSPLKDTGRIQLILLKNAIPAIICFSLSLLSLLVLYTYNLSFNNLISLAVYGLSSLVYYLLISIIYKAKTTHSRLLFNILSCLIRMIIFYLIALIFISNLSLPYQIFIPLGMVISSLIDVVFSSLIKKIYRN